MALARSRSVSEVFTNQKQLEVEAKNLQTQSAKYAKQTSQWLAMIDSFNNALKVRPVRPVRPTRPPGGRAFRLTKRVSASLPPISVRARCARNWATSRAGRRALKMTCERSRPRSSTFTRGPAPT